MIRERAEDRAVLDVRALTISYRSARRTVAAVRDLSFSVFPGEVVAVVGESGSGKSSTAHALIGLLPAGGRILSGAITFQGRQVTGLGERAWRTVRGKEIGFIPQDPMVSLTPTHRVGHQVAEVLRIHGMATRSTARSQAVEALREAGIPDPDRRALQYPHELSGGLRQRVLIAIGLACRPRLLIADEPTSALDVTVQRQILDRIAALTASSRTAVLLITHDLAVAADRAQRILVMQNGQLVEHGVASDVLCAPRHAYSRQLIAKAPSLHGARLVPRVQATASPAHGRAGAVEPLLVIDNLVKEYELPASEGKRETVRALDGVSLQITRGETLSLVGESGSGKSTTARLVLGLDRPTAGSVLVHGVDLATADRQEIRRLRRKMQIVFQNPFDSLNPRFSVAELIDEPLRAFRIGDRRARRDRVGKLLEMVALSPTLRERKPRELSGGQRQRVAIARALALEPDLVVCDEPVSSLDVSVQAQILELLVDLQGALGLSYLFISHDLGVVRQISDRVAVMRKGKIVESGPTGEVLEHPAHAYTQELVEAIPGRRRADRPAAKAEASTRMTS